MPLRSASARSKGAAALLALCLRVLLAVVAVAAVVGGVWAAWGGLSLAAMPEPEHLGPLGAHLVAEEFTACRGRVIFAGGSEVAVIDEPRLIEVVRGDDVPAPLLKAATTTALR